MNGVLSDSSTFFVDGLRGGDLPAGVGVGAAEIIVASISIDRMVTNFVVFIVCCSLCFVQPSVVLTSGSVEQSPALRSKWELIYLNKPARGSSRAWVVEVNLPTVNAVTVR